ncbi:uncharacterized protein LOC142330001 [Lycorma delicatula]|uniref:uncharacterized protein LOC142330001 n=1 Tax=Lycorma delicatula TaxID=130591 RepID=UPI003F514F83
MPKSSSLKSYINDVNGKVASIVTKHKAILTFKHNGKDERALLMYEKLKFNGLDLPVEGNIADYLHVGSLLTFTCHTFDETGPDRCGWFVTIAWHCSVNKISYPELGFTGFGFEGKCNMVGTITEVAKRQGILSFAIDGANEKVLFLASKLFLYGNRASRSLKDYPELEEGSKLMFDAVPCNENENDYNCRWFATLVWCGPKKPYVEYDVIGTSIEKFKSNDLLSQIKMVSLNPRSTFIRGIGQILHILNPEYGLALGAIQPNSWHSILFHRSMCFLFKMSLSRHDLTKIFKEGDKISFTAVPAPKKFITQWIATNISIYNEPSITDNFDF